jgi:hypothetical protein
MPGVAIGPIVLPALLMDCEPDQPSDPVPPAAAQAVAFVADHFNVNEAPG